MVDTFGAGGRLHQLIRHIEKRTGLVVTVTTPNDLFMQIIDSAIPEGQSAERGLRVSVFGSAIGSAYLSMLDEAEVARLADRARFSKDETKQIIKSVAQIRRDGFADGPIANEAIWSIALPLPMQGLSVPTVLGLAGPPEQMRANLAAYRQVMVEAIAQWLGAPD
jgi:DNA-binding IclR family transcriptional regulator